MSPEEEDAKIREILGQSVPGSFQFCESWERRREEVLAIALSSEPTFREVVYQNLPKGRHVKIYKGSCELAQNFEFIVKTFIYNHEYLVSSM